MSVKSIDHKTFEIFGAPINIEENYEFLCKYSSEEKTYTNRNIAFTTTSPVYIEKLSGQSVLNCSSSKSGGMYRSFYFDSQLKLETGVTFSFTPLTPDFSYIIYYLDEPAVIYNSSPIDLSEKSILNCKNLFMISDKHFKDGLIFRPERQPFWEMMYITCGEGIRMIDGKKYEVKGGYVSFVPPNSEHFLTADNSFNMLVVMFEMDCEYADYLVKPVFASPVIKQYINAIFLKMESNDTFLDDTILHLVSLIALDTISINKRCSMEDGGISLSSALRMKQVIEAAELIVEENILNPDLSVGFISEKLYVSQSYLYRCAMHKYGYGISEYIRNRKLDEAKILIANGIYALSEISNNLNFCSQSYFTTLFRKKFGVSPLKYSQQLNKNQIE